MKYKSYFFFGLLVALLAPAAFADVGGTGSSGGGDSVKLDFLAAAYQAAIAIDQQAATLVPAVDSAAFRSKIDLNRIETTEDVLLDSGAPVDAYYDHVRDIIRINKAGWQSIPTNVEKMRLAAHEIFRRQGLNDGQYQISRQLLEVRTVNFNVTYAITKQGEASMRPVSVTESVMIPLTQCLSSAGFSDCQGNWNIVHEVDGHRFHLNITGTSSVSPSAPAVFGIKVNMFYVINPAEDVFWDGFRNLDIELFHANSPSGSASMNGDYFIAFDPNQTDLNYIYEQTVTIGPWRP